MPPAWLTASNVAMNVLAGTMTSSPGSIPAATSPSRSASSPLASPMQARAPQVLPPEGGLERRHRVAVGEVAAIDQLRYARQELVLDRRVGMAEVQEWHAHALDHTGGGHDVPGLRRRSSRPAPMPSSIAMNSFDGLYGSIVRLAE
jgi:hypothetical protein